MHKVTILFLFVAFLGTSKAQKLLPFDEGSSVKFSIKNFGFSTSGNFTGLKGNIQFDAGNITAANFVVSVDTKTINTGNNARDNHLRKDDYFDVAKFPLILFTSVSVSKDAGSTGYIMSGRITIKDVTKQITFPFTAIVQNNGYLFTGSFSLNRRDFGVGGNSMVLADNLQVSLNILTKKN